MKIEYVFRPIEKWPREETRRRIRAPFKSLHSHTMDLLEGELRKIGARQVVLQLDLRESDIRLDGRPRSDRAPSSPRVIVAFEGKHGWIQMPCDRFDHWKDNLRAIALGLEALRKVDRYGITVAGEQYRGWKALPPAGTISTLDAAAEFLSTHSAILASVIVRSPDSFNVAYREAARRLHPDVGGSRDTWDLLQAAVGVLRAHHAKGQP